MAQAGPAETGMPASGTLRSRRSPAQTRESAEDSALESAKLDQRASCRLAAFAETGYEDFWRTWEVANRIDVAWIDQKRCRHQFIEAANRRAARWHRPAIIG